MIQSKTYLVMGVANKKSVAYQVVTGLLELGHKVIISVQNKEVKKTISLIFPDQICIVCDVEKFEHIQSLPQHLEENNIEKIDGFVHSLAYAQFDDSTKVFHEVPWEKFQQAMLISSYSLIQISNSLSKIFSHNASVVSIGISNTKATVYGYLGPIKATLEASIPYLAKSFSSFSQVRFNIVCAGPLKTSASAGIPHYIDNYLFAEKMTLRKNALKTQEVANTIIFLLSDKSSGINAERIIIDAGMNCNVFDENIVKSINS